MLTYGIYARVGEVAENRTSERVRFFDQNRLLDLASVLLKSKDGSNYFRCNRALFLFVKTRKNEQYATSIHGKI